MKLRAPAKVNLQLLVLGRRDDGFHDLDTLMAPLALADDITVEVGEGSGVELSCSDPAVPLGEGNLATKAARVFARAVEREFSCRIQIEKRIPMGAGLAGGSSDGATVLLALNAIFDSPLSVAKLEGLAAELGSDVPFFIRGVAARCGGRGEKITPEPLAEQYPVVLLKPPFGVETAWAYRNWLSADYPADAPQQLGSLTIANSLERPVFQKYLLLPTIKRWLLAQPETRVAAMSGSGSTLFAIPRSAEEGAALAERAREEFGTTLWTAVTETI